MVERILALIKERGITAYKLTLELGLANSSVTDWGRGKAKPSTDAIIKIAQYFDVSTDYLLTGKEHTGEPQRRLEKERENIVMSKRFITPMAVF